LINKDLFAGSELREYFASRRRAADEAVQRWDPDALLATPTEDLVARLAEEFGVSTLELHTDRMEQLEVKETQVRVIQAWPGYEALFHDRARLDLDSAPTRFGSATRRRLIPGASISVAVPFDGDQRLFYMKASTYMTGELPSAHIDGNELVLTYTDTDPSADQAKAFIDRELSAIQKNLEWINRDIDQFCAQFRGEVRKMVEGRKARLRRDRGLEGALGIPFRRRSGALPVPVRIRRKRLGLRRASASAQPYQDEYALEQAHYEEIIDIILAMGRAFERSSSMVADAHEEKLRDLILLQLNGTFEGHAGGELFNGKGKTDILVRIADRNVVIGECKFWPGSKQLGKAIDQLLRYLVWRDTKAALVLFIRQRDATAVIDKADIALRAHPNFKRPGPASSDPHQRRNFILHQTDDPNREIAVALLPVVIHQPAEPAIRRPTNSHK
jgi:hypothetical protein